MASVALMASCNGASNATTSNASETAPGKEYRFNADSAYSYVAQQVMFGPRVPNTAASDRCADWLVGMLNQFGAKNVNVQRAPVTAFNGQKLIAKNITAQYNPEMERRILLLSHWDSRPWADMENDPALRQQAIDGANDGASGVGVILEMARLFSEKAPSVGVDILLVDAEDYGTESHGVDKEDTWCLGTQYWVANPTLDTSKIQYGILLDMVGGKDAVFNREYHSQYACSKINDAVWQAARRAGHGARFVDRMGAPVIDDHVYLIMNGIPAIDIIESNHPSTGSFNPTWHTLADNIDNIDRATLKAVGQTLEEIVY